VKIWIDDVMFRSADSLAEFISLHPYTGLAFFIGPWVLLALSWAF
jgi:hypothetical protein